MTRPSPHPRPRPLPYRRAVEVLAAPGAGHRRAAQRGAVAAIAAGVALFVVASALTSGADAAPKPAAAPHPLGHLRQPTPVPLSDGGTIAALDPTAYGPQQAPRHHAAKPATKVATDVSVSSLAANGIPTVALNAYRVAAARLGSAEASCGIDWALLAGIGRVESDHGRFGGAVLHADGTSTPKIIGPALDGHGSAAIPAPANGVALDGDAKWTHALGPMQFIPQTWAGYGADADGDGRADIFDIDDAALGAARYLCAAGGDLRTHAGRVRAVMAYNHVPAYVAEVLALADAYRRGIPISGVPIGKLTGKLPPVKHTGTAANPGGPTAVGGKGKPTHVGHPSGGAPGSGSTSPSSSPPGSSSSHSGSTSSSASTRPSSPTSSTSSSSGSSPPSSPPSGSLSSPPGSSSSGSGAPTAGGSSTSCAVPLGSACVLP